MCSEPRYGEIDREELYPLVPHRALTEPAAAAGLCCW